MTQLRTVLTEGLLTTFHERAPRYDAENSFFTEDLEDLRHVGYLRAAVPVELGGLGLTIEEVLAEQRRLAYWAPATALALNMHLYWVGSAADAHRRGDRTQDWLLNAAAEGKVFAAGHGERGNDAVIDDSTTRAVPVDGGYRFTGSKVFTSLSPAWEWLGLHGRDDSDPDHPKIVHGFLHRSAAGITIKDTWDTVGVRATQSNDTDLADAFVPAERIVDVVDVGSAPGAFIAGIFQWVLPGLGNVYYGIGRRALDLAIEAAKRQTSLVEHGAPIASKPLIQSHTAEGELVLESVRAQLDEVGSDLAADVDWGERTLLRLFAAKENGVRAGLAAVTSALAVGGAGSLYTRNELQRLYRDVIAGQFHPPKSDLALLTIGQIALG